MAYVDKINVQGTDYDIRDKRIAATEDVNVKPIYYHPIFDYYDNTDESLGVNITFVIIDNNSVAYTPSTLLQKLKDLMDLGALIQVDGFIKDNGTVCFPYLISKGENVYTCTAVDATGTMHYFDLEDLINPNTISDGVNKIN